MKKLDTTIVLSRCFGKSINGETNSKTEQMLEIRNTSFLWDFIKFFKLSKVHEYFSNNIIETKLIFIGKFVRKLSIEGVKDQVVVILSNADYVTNRVSWVDCRLTLSSIGVNHKKHVIKNFYRGAYYL